MKLTLTVVLISSCLISCSPRLTNHRTIRIQTGTSTWKIDGEVFSDSQIDHILKFDSLGNLREEIKIFRDFEGIKIDSVHSTYDDNENEIRYHSLNDSTTYYMDYDSLNTQIQVSFMRDGDTITQKNLPHYSEVTDNSKRFTKTHSNTIMSTTLVIWNNQNQLTFYETKQESIPSTGSSLSNALGYEYPPQVETYVWEYDKHGKLVKYEKKLNQEILKTTTHIYQDGLEVRRIEQYFNPNYSITTEYSYNFW